MVYCQVPNYVVKYIIEIEHADKMDCLQFFALQLFYIFCNTQSWENVALSSIYPFLSIFKTIN